MNYRKRFVKSHKNTFTVCPPGHGINVAMSLIIMQLKDIIKSQKEKTELLTHRDYLYLIELSIAEYVRLCSCLIWASNTNLWGKQHSYKGNSVHICIPRNYAVKYQQGAFN